MIIPIILALSFLIGTSYPDIEIVPNQNYDQIYQAGSTK